MSHSAQPTQPGGDPAIDAQLDTTTSKEVQIKELYELADGFPACLLTTHRPEAGLVARIMAVARRDGPDFLFLTDKNSQKFKDISHDKDCQVTFQDTKTMNWISVAGTATTTDNSDPRVAETFNPMVGVWFGDLGDGKHDGSKNDPRVALIEVKAKYVTYWKKTTGTLGFVKELGKAAATGNIATVGITRTLTADDLDAARKLS